MLLNFPQYTGRSTTKNYAVQNTNSAKVKKPRFPHSEDHSISGLSEDINPLTDKDTENPGRPQSHYQVRGSQDSRSKVKSAFYPESSTAPGTAQGRCLLA